MNPTQCPRCKIDADIYKAPPGKVVRNSEAVQHGMVFDDCKACEGTGHVPTKVVESITNFARTPERAAEILSQLRWSYDHFSFNTNGMYVGVELDGYLHT